MPLLDLHVRAASWARRHAYVAIALTVGAVFVATFVLAEAFSAPWVADPRGYLDSETAPVAALGVGLLTADVLLPVPSSGVMVAHGAVFGPVVGAVLSLLGGSCATLVAYAMGRSGQPVVDRFVDSEQRRRGAALLERHGVWAIIASRPIPVLAETTGILAGATGALPWWKATLAGAVGNVVPAVGYAAAGSYAANTINTVVVFLGVLVVASGAWLIERAVRRPTSGV